MQYLLGFVWGFLLLAGFAGWGLGLRRILLPGIDGDAIWWAPAPVFGMACIVAVAGPLNLQGAMTVTVVWVLLVVGLILFGLETGRFVFRIGPTRSFRWPLSPIEGLVLACCLVAYGSGVCLGESPYGDPNVRLRFTLNPWDDLHGGYISGPLRLLSEGCLGDDPFNGPRSLSLGGQPVLQSFALLILPPTYIHLLDPGLAILTLPLVLGWLGRRNGWPGWLAPSLTLFALVLKMHWVNASAQLLPTVLLLTMYGVLDSLAREPTPRAPQLFMVALLASTLITLKNVLIPGTCLVLGIFLILDYVARRETLRTVASGSATFLMMLLLLAPWMVSSYRASGTPLYPLLGEGYWANTFGNMPSLAPDRDLTAEARQLLPVLKDPRILLLLLLSAPGLAFATRLRLRQGSGVAYLAVLLTSIPVVFLYAHIFVGDWVRYSYNFTVLATLASFAVLLGSQQGQCWLDALVGGGTKALVALLILLIVVGFAYQTVYVRRTATMIAKTIRGTAWDPDAERDHYGLIQAAIPPGERILSFLPMAHLFNYRRNPIHVAHLNCGISPPPGMPLKGTAQEFAGYLRSRGISWFATRDTFWTPSGEGRDPEAIRRWSESYKTDREWDLGAVYSYYLMARCVQLLMATHETRRFDGDLVLINLGRPISQRVFTSDSEGRTQKPGTGLRGRGPGGRDWQFAF